MAHNIFLLEIANASSFEMARFKITATLFSFLKLQGIRNRENKKMVTIRKKKIIPIGEREIFQIRKYPNFGPVS
jgi:hypothetical protein